VSASLRQIFVIGALGYMKLGAFLEGLRRLISYKLALHVLVTFTEQVFPILKHITFILNYLGIRNKNSKNESSEKSSGEIVSPHSRYIFDEYFIVPVQSEKWIQKWIHLCCHWGQPR